MISCNCSDNYTGALNISDVRAARDQINIAAIPYPAMPIQDAAPRASSVFSQPSSACSSTHSFNGPFNGGVVSPQPHSSYYSGMTGPQHPFYNRVRNNSSLKSALFYLVWVPYLIRNCIS